MKRHEAINLLWDYIRRRYDKRFGRIDAEILLNYIELEIGMCPPVMPETLFFPPCSHVWGEDQ